MSELHPRLRCFVPLVRIERDEEVGFRPSEERLTELAELGAVGLSKEMLQDMFGSINFGLGDAEYTETGSIKVRSLNRFGSFGKAGVIAGDEVIEIDGCVPECIEKITFMNLRTGVGGVQRLKVKRGDQFLELDMKLLKRRILNIDLENIDLELERKIAP